MLLSENEVATSLRRVRKIGIYTSSVNHFIETITYWIAADKNIEVLLITPEKSKGPEHAWCLKRLFQCPFSNVKIISPLSPSIDTDWLYISLTGKKPTFSYSLNRWIRKAENTGIITHSNYQGSWKRILKEVMYALPYNLLASSTILQIGDQSRHPYSFIKNKCFYSPSVHPQYIVNESYAQLLFVVEKEYQAEREFKFTYLGNKNPPEREMVLKRVRNALNTVAEPTYLEDYPLQSQPTERSMNILWIEYGDQGSKRGLKPPEYIKALNETDFCISPLGWGGNWTHRVIEALVCGAIPILEDADRYNIGLTDMETCISVKNGNWEEAIERATKLEPKEVIAMRSRIEALRENYLLPEIAAHRFRESLNLN